MTQGFVRRAVYRICGFAVLLVLWQIAGKSGVAGKTLPALTDVLRVYTVGFRRALLLRSAIATASSAGLGLLLGAVLGFATALIARLAPILAPGLNRLAVVVHALPAIALGPILIITAGRDATPMLLATIPVYFLLYVAVSSGLSSADRRLEQLFIASGAGAWKRFVYLEAVAALPTLLSGLKLAVTTAMIGAVIGEWFGAPIGLGIVILNTMQNFQIPLMWATVLVVAAISLSAYALIGVAERAVQKEVRVIGNFFKKSWAVILLLLLWQVWVMTTDYNSIVVVSPISVARDFLLHAPVYLLPALWTAGFALGGLALGMIAGLLLAMACWWSRVLSGLLQPAALLLTATPVVCLIPVLARLFGYQGRTEIITVTIMTFFPSFVYAGAGLHRLPPRSLELFQTLHASRSKRLLLLALPAAVPNLAVALRVGTAYSILVTVVAEFLMQTGGLGDMFAVTMQQFNLHRAFGASIVAMALSTALYEAGTALEHRVRRYFT